MSLGYEGVTEVQPAVSAIAPELAGATMSDRTLRRVAGVLTVAVAGVHLYWALPVLSLQLRVGMVHDPRPIAFILASFAMIFGLLLAVQGFDRRPLYVGGMVLMVVFIVGYASWHTVLEHGGFWPGRPAHGHDAPFHEVMITHLRADPVALFSKLTELALLAVLGVLYAQERDD